MTLATRCPACGTTFRVVQDQLKVSGGWVRCGHCHEVFNGLEALFELPPEPPAGAAPPPPPAPPPDFAATRPFEMPDEDETERMPLDLSEPRSWREPGRDPPAAPAVSQPLPAGMPSHLWLDRSEPPTPSRPAPSPPEPVEPSLAARAAAAATAHESVFSDEWLRAPEDTTSAPMAPADAVDTILPSPAVPEPVAEPGPPAFVRQAERAARWHRPHVRAALGSASALLAAGLLLQIAHQQRDQIAARWPVLHAPLAAWCRVAGCRLAAPRALASLVLDSSSLTKTAQDQVLRFEADLRNTGTHPVRAPAIELSLADPLGRQVVRKVLLPEQLSAPPQGIAADGAWHVDARLQVGDLHIAGFTAEIFYP